MSVRVVHVVVAGDVGGAERLLVDLASHPAESGASHAVALMTPNPKLRDLFVQNGLRVRDRGPVRENALAYLWRSLGPADVAWLEGVLRDERATLAHLHTFASHVLGTRAAARAAIPTLRTEHHVDYFHDPSTSPFTRWSLRRADAVVAISEYVRDAVARTAPYAAAKMRVVRNGVDADYFAHRPLASRDDPRFRFVVVCRLEPWKQVHLAVLAMADVPSASLTVVGDGSARASLEALVRERGLGDRVRFEGYQRDPRDALAAADVAINSSRDEPLGLSVLEAEAVGRPVIAFDGGGIPEIVRDGETGWLVRRRDPAALAEAMRDASRDRERARRMGDAARAFVDAHCRIETMCEGYGVAYASLVSARR